MTPEAAALLAKYDKECDPILAQQVAMFDETLGDAIDMEVMDGFLIFCARLVDNFGDHRTAELFAVLETHRFEGRRVLAESLANLSRCVGGIDAYVAHYPVTINPSSPAYPQLRIVGIEALFSFLYRVMDSRATFRGTGEPLGAYISRTGTLPPVPIQQVPVLRQKPRYHWTSHQKWLSPADTRASLQILKEWGTDCCLRASIPTASMGCSAFVAFNGDTEDPSDPTLRFYNYFYEPIARDHDALPGGGSQIGLDGAPRVEVLELWDAAAQRWNSVWSR
jgi:hypothetical protein